MGGKHWGSSWLVYAFWRAWILAVYSAPIWASFEDTAGWPAWAAMYAWSTLSFVAVSFLAAAFHKRCTALLSGNSVILGSGAACAAGMAVEYASLAMHGTSTGPLFVLGALLTGIGTGIISTFAGNLYARFEAAEALSCAMFSEAIAAALFFVVAGTFKEAALLLAAAFPLIGVIVALSQKAVLRSEGSDESLSFVDAPQSAETTQGNGAGPTLSRKEVASFVRFLVAVLVLTFTATFTRNLGADFQNFAEVVPAVTIGITVVAFVAFALGIIAQFARGFNFGALYYPLVVLLAFAVILALAGSGDNPIAQAGIVFVYNMFSMFMWCMLVYTAKGGKWTPTQVFGWGRGVFAVGSLAGLMLALNPNVQGLLAQSDSLMTGLLLAFLLTAMAVLIFRESDARRIVASLPSEASSIVTGDAACTPAAEVPEASGVEQQAYVASIGLTAREREVFPLMLEGRDARHISGALFISENTAKAHIRNIYLKVGVHNRQEFIDATRDVQR